MGGDGGVLGGVGEFLFGDPTEDLDKAYEQSTGLTREAMAVQMAAQEKARKAFTEKMDLALAEYQKGNPEALNALIASTQAGIGAGMAGAQTQEQMLRYGAAAAEAARQPTQMARLGALQALPQLQQFIGTQAYNVPTSATVPGMPGINYAGAMNAAAPAAAAMTTPIAATQPGAAAAATTPAAAPGGAAAVPAAGGFTLTPYTGPAFNYQESPIYKLQQEQTTRNINRALAARGLSTGAAGAAVQGEAARELSAAEAEKAYGRLMDQVQIGLGYDTSSPYAQAAERIGSVYGNLGTTTGAALTGLGANVANLAGTSAANRAQLYQNYGQGLASAYTGQGAAQGQGLLSLAQNVDAYGNALAATPSAGSQLINLGMTAYGAGMFGTGNQMPANTGMNYPVPAVMMRQFTDPYGIGY